ncbi:MAG: tyrosine-protein phosphatase [Phycisphaerales bacterium]|jgi:protein tyrosine phosphatase (PTP) superfamily phosphohydrolase (DUF442 family)|nr:tyrosine-protein phosphatase [Phycisphaerales bacterium]
MDQQVETKSKKGVSLMAVIAIGLAVLFGAGVYFEFFDVYRLETVKKGVLYRDGMRNTREFGTAIREVKPKTVVNLVTEAEFINPDKGDFQGEAKLLEREGIELVRIPIKTGGPPTEADIEKFLSIVKDPARQPVLVHCAQGIVRTGMMVAAFQKDVLGYDKQQALEAVNIFGKGWQRGARVKWFIERYYDEGKAPVTTADAPLNDPLDE